MLPFARLGAGFGATLALHPFSPTLAQEVKRQTCRRFLDEVGVELRLDDQRRPHTTPALYVHLDQQTLLSVAVYPLIIPGPFAYIINVEFALLPIFGWQTVVEGAVVIVRQWPAQARAGMRRAARLLASGTSLGMSIEGRRSSDGSLSPYKKGAALLAIEAQCDLVPFMTHGEWQRWPKGSVAIRPGVIDAVVYPPISTRGMRHADRHDLVATLRQLAERERRARGLSVP
jgi:1-acyl-sn-glycerol-3-phosphate acyltransferase